MRLISALVAALFCSQVFAGEAIFTLVGVGISNDSKTIYIQTLESQSTVIRCQVCKIAQPDLDQQCGIRETEGR